MKKILATLLATSMMAPAAMALEVKGVTLDFDHLSFVSDRGEAVARDIFVEIGNQGSAARKQTRKSVPQNLALYRDKSDIRLATGNIDVSWNKIPKCLTTDLDLKADDLKIKLGYAPSNEITAGAVTIHKNGLGEASLKGVKVLCTPQSKMAADFEKILPQCLEKGVITASEVSLPSLWDALRDMGVDEQLDKSDNYRRVGNGLEVGIENGKFNFQMNLATPLLQKFIKLTVNASGELKLDEKTNIIRLRIDEARIKNFKLTKFIPAVASVLFPPEVIRVEGGYLYLSLNDIKK